MSNKIVAGDLLIAHPSLLGDDTFHRSVILLCSLENEAPIGFILNQSLDYDLQDLLPEVKQRFPVYNGGPVNSDHLFFIHYGIQLLPDAQPLGKDIYFGGNVEAALLAIENGTLHAQNSRFFLGYSGWTLPQLESEIASEAWLVQSNTASPQIFNVSPKNLWSEALRHRGGEFNLWAHTPQNPSYN